MPLSARYGAYSEWQKQLAWFWFYFDLVPVARAYAISVARYQVYITESVSFVFVVALFCIPLIVFAHIIYVPPIYYGYPWSGRS